MGLRNPSSSGLCCPMSVCPSISGLGVEVCSEQSRLQAWQCQSQPEGRSSLVAHRGVRLGLCVWGGGGGFWGEGLSPVAVPLLCFLPTPREAGLLTPKATSGAGRREETGGWD